MSTPLFTPRHFGYFAGIAAIHGVTVRLTYTVPAGKRAECHNAVIVLIADGTFATFNASIMLRINGVVQLAIVNAGVGVFSVSIPGVIDLVGGDVIEIATSNAVANFCEFSGTLQIREYG